MDQIVDKLQEWFVLYGLKVIAAVIILAIGRLAAKSIRKIIRGMLHKGKIDDTLVSFVSSLCYVGTLVFVVIAALGQIGVQTSSFVAMLGAAGLAIGLALQGSLANFAAGILRDTDDHLQALQGDCIEGGGVSGVVEEIGIFTTELKSPDNKMIIVPNGKMTGDSIINYTAKEIRRVDIVVGVSYGDDLDKVRRVLGDVLAQDGRIIKDPAPTIGVLELGQRSVNLAVRPWVKTADYGEVLFATQESIKKQFEAEGICIPLQQQDVQLR